MAAKIVDQGLQRIADTVSQTSGYSASRYIQTMAIDDSNTAFANGDTSLNSPASVYSSSLDSTPIRNGQTVSHVMTIPSGSGNFTIRRVSLHDDTQANVNGASTTLFGGVDGQSITKTADFLMQITMSITYTDAS